MPVVTLLIAEASSMAWALSHAHILSDEEQLRLHRLRSRPRRRAQFCIARVLLRLALQQATGLPCAKWRLTADAAGAPMAHWPKQRGSEVLCPHKVSLAHSEGHVVAAVGPFAALGVDTELPGRFAAAPERAEKLQRALCCSKEQQRIEAVAANQRALAFLQQWALKEAACKSTGFGLRGPWRNVAPNVRLGPLGTHEQRYAAAPLAMPQAWAAQGAKAVWLALVDTQAAQGPIVAVAVAAAAPVHVDCTLKG